jgi:hypothetical protein
MHDLQKMMMHALYVIGWSIQQYAALITDQLISLRKFEVRQIINEIEADDDQQLRDQSQESN